MTKSPKASSRGKGMKSTITVDAERLLRLCDLLLFASKRTQARLNLRHVSAKLIGCDSSTCAGKTTLRIYPSDRFLNLAARFLAKQFDIRVCQ